MTSSHNIDFNGL